MAPLPRSAMAEQGRITLDRMLKKDELHYRPPARTPDNCMGRRHSRQPLGRRAVIRLEALKSAADEFLTSALIGENFEAALSRLADAADASDAVLSLDNGFATKDALCTPGAVESVSAFLAGDCPPNPRTMRCAPGLKEGFRADQDDFTPEELTRSPWYQEFLRPRDYFWNATAALLRGPGGEGAYVSLKRGPTASPFGRADIETFREVLPDLRRAASLGRRMRDFETLGMVKLIHERGDPVFELDIWGRVLRVHAFDDRAGPALRVVQRRLKVADHLAQAALDRALAKALARPSATAAARLPAGLGDWRYLLIVPVLGRARDMFLTAAAVAVLVKPRRRPTPLMLSVGALRDLFGLTDREAAVAMRLADGLSLEAAARSLKIGVGTARNHLKGVFEKTGTKRQSELVAMLGALRP